jgi:hypothetical protein
MRPSGEEGDLPPGSGVADAGGTTIVPGLADGHSHLTLPGGSHWIALGAEPATVSQVALHHRELKTFGIQRPNTRGLSERSGHCEYLPA